ncbi:thymidylate kinase [Candidatus Phycosocius bacilliformis]|uniref:ADP/GDP-polyphosphate phosphotransferase n=1 Tax=Candidatus Phycosocius bacilliformis TaxID=1445552 RepID=A0A2P2EAL1_9PROT|nr:polyphosphate kinase 2 [Candidatus Phycosocius bacilliformis]GBF58082.1 thymidylate kinase [Candidatus Phycosocius bacilliformis]
MARNTKTSSATKLSEEAFLERLEPLQIAMVKTQQWLMDQGIKVLIVFEGRDAAGKDGSIKRLVEHMSARATRVVALPKPSDREKSQWHFQRYTAHLPAAGEVVIFNRSWYNRGGVEPVMGFCTPEEHADFLRDVVPFETMLHESGTRIIKLWLDISREEQAKRLEERRSDPLSQLKISPLDAVAQEKWDDYSAARNQMLTHTHSARTPWVCVRADSKKHARLAIMAHILRELACPNLTKPIAAPSPDLLFKFTPKAIKDGRLAV